MTYELAKRLKEAGFTAHRGMLKPGAEFYITPNVLATRVMMQNVFHHPDGSPVATNYWVYKPTLEDLLEFLGDKVEVALETAAEEALTKLYGN